MPKHGKGKYGQVGHESGEDDDLDHLREPLLGKGDREDSDESEDNAAEKQSGIFVRKQSRAGMAGEYLKDAAKDAKDTVGRNLFGSAPHRNKKPDSYRPIGSTLEQAAVAKREGNKKGSGPKKKSG